MAHDVSEIKTTASEDVLGQVVNMGSEPPFTFAETLEDVDNSESLTTPFQVRGSVVAKPSLLREVVLILSPNPTINGGCELYAEWFGDA